MTRIASRFMPKYVQPELRAVNKFVLFGFYCLLAVAASAAVMFFVNNPTALIIIPILALVHLYHARAERKHFTRLQHEREAMSICQFARHFDCQQVDTWVIRAVYEQLQEYLNLGKHSKQLAILPSDHAIDDLHIDEEDFDYLIDEIAQRTGRSLEGHESNAHLANIALVENLVYFFNEQPLAAHKFTN